MYSHSYILTIFMFYLQQLGFRFVVFLFVHPTSGLALYCKYSLCTAVDQNVQANYWDFSVIKVSHFQNGKHFFKDKLVLWHVLKTFCMVSRHHAFAVKPETPNSLGRTIEPIFVYNFQWHYTATAGLWIYRFFVAAGHSGTLYINISGRQLTVRLFLVTKWSGITEKKFILLKVVNFSLEIIETGKWH